MNEYKWRIVKIVGGILGVLVCLALLVLGHMVGSFGNLSQGIWGLVLELVGLAGLVTLLWLYNRGFNK